MTLTCWTMRVTAIASMSMAFQRHMASLLRVRVHAKQWTQWLNALWRDGMHKFQHQPTTLGRWGLSAAEWEARTVRATRLTAYDHCGCETHTHEDVSRSHHA